MQAKVEAAFVPGLTTPWFEWIVKRLPYAGMEIRAQDVVPYALAGSALRVIVVHGNGRDGRAQLNIRTEPSCTMLNPSATTNRSRIGQRERGRGINKETVVVGERSAHSRVAGVTDDWSRHRS